MKSRQLTKILRISTAIHLIAVSAITLSVIRFSYAQPPANFPAKHMLFLPGLIEDRNPTLCQLALNEARERFLNTKVDTKVIETSQDGVSWPDWEQTSALSTPTNNGEAIYRISLDLDGTGDRQTLLYLKVPHSWRGDNYSSYVVRSDRALKDLQDKHGTVAELKERLDSSMQHGTEAGEIVQYYPNAFLAVANTNDSIGTGTDWQPPRLLRWRGQYFFYDESPDSKIMDGHISLYRLRGDGKVVLECSISTSPEKKLIDEFRNTSGMGSFLQVLSTIGAGGVGDCGTLHANYNHDASGSAAITRAAVRPWAISQAWNGYFVYDDRMLEFIRDWSYGDIWNRREYQTFLQHVEPAKRAMEHYLTQEFDVPKKDAVGLAQAATEQLIAAWIQVPRSYSPGKDRYSVNYSALTAALMTRDLVALKTAIANFNPKEVPWRIRPLSDHLHDAVEWPSGMAALLAAGADSNFPRNSNLGFGKTPLMTAAHMNRPDSVRLLLAHHANPNSRTVDSKNDCGLVIERGRRSPLMYAAENAGPEVMKLLLDSGSDPDAKDSKGDGIAYYLDRNPRLTSDEKHMEIRALVKQQLSKHRGPGFDCSKANQQIEILICSDEVLRLMDGEMAEAYSRWHRVDVSRARSDQLRWIGDRSKACMSGDKDKAIGCLQDQTRARIRYLHNRLDEMPQL